MQAGAYGGLYLATAAGFHPLAIFAFHCGDRVCDRRNPLKYHGQRAENLRMCGAAPRKAFLSRYLLGPSLKSFATGVLRA
jgi:hypothetical protein